MKFLVRNTILYSLIISMVLSTAILYASETSNFIYIDQEISGDTTDLALNDTVPKHRNLSDKVDRIVKIFPIPYASYSTETNWLFGMTKINAFRLGTKDQRDESIQPSKITALVYLTLNKQYKGILSSDLIFGENKYEIFTEIIFADFPNYYYGVGNYTHDENQCTVDVENLSITQSFGYKFSENMYVGIKYHFDNYMNVDTIPGSAPCMTNVEDLTKNEGIQSGIGLKLSRETRDNRFNASKGSLIFIEFMNYGKWLGSKFDYNSLTIDLRKFITPLKWLTIGGQLYSEANFGNLPVQSLALMGGDDRMRGIYIGRFREKTMIEGQIEARFPIYWLLSGVVFSGLGESAAKYNLYSFGGLKWTYGAGLRVMINSATKTNLRFDIGFYDHKPLYFFNISEAF